MSLIIATASEIDKSICASPSLTVDNSRTANASACNVAVLHCVLQRFRASETTDAPKAANSSAVRCSMSQYIWRLFPNTDMRELVHALKAKQISGILWCSTLLANLANLDIKTCCGHIESVRHGRILQCVRHGILQIALTDLRHTTHSFWTLWYGISVIVLRHVCKYIRCLQCIWVEDLASISIFNGIPGGYMYTSFCERTALNYIFKMKMTMRRIPHSIHRLWTNTNDALNIKFT